MNTNYNLFSHGDCFDKKAREVDRLSHFTPRKSFFKNLLTLLILLTGVFNTNAQALSGTDQGGFEGSATNNYGWTIVNSSTNFWVIGSGATPSNGSNSIYITNDNTTKPYTYTTSVVTPNYSWFYRDITVPTGQSLASVSYKWKNQGESGNDQIKVYIASTDIMPTANNPLASNQATDLSITSYGQNTYQAVPATLLPITSTKPGTTFRLIFGWTNNTTLGGPNPASIDEINVNFAASGSKTALASGFWGDENMWATTATSLTGTITTSLTTKTVTGVGTAFKSEIGIGSNLYAADGTTLIGSVVAITSDTSITLAANSLTVTAASAFKGKIAPLATDDVTIPSGITVTQNILASATSGANITINNLTIDTTGSLILNNGVTSGGTFTCTGDLTVKGTLDNSYARALTVAGNVTNDGIINFNAATISTFTLNGMYPQTVSGSGGFGYTTSDSNAYKVIKAAIKFSNQSTTYPNIIWSLDNIVVTGTISLNSSYPQRINMDTRRLFIGYSLDDTTKSGSITSSSFANGFYSGARISKYFSVSSLGSSFTATSATEGIGRYPFITPSGDSRHIYLGRTTNGATEGDLEVTYTHAGSTSDLSPSVADDSYTINKRYDGHWGIATNNGLASDTFDVGMDAYNGLNLTNVANARVMHQNTALTGTHFNGLSTLSGGSLNTFAIRKGVSQADLTASDIYMGIGNDDTYTIYSTVSGDWSDADTWNTLTVPTSSDRVFISSGTEVSAYDNGNGDNYAMAINIAPGGSLSFPSNGNLTVGSTTHNNSLINNGTFKMNDAGAKLYLNGYFLNNTGGTFIQNSGTIEIDGNDGNILTSVPTGKPLFQINFTPATIQLGATAVLTIKNPHIGASLQDYSVYFNNSVYNTPYAAPTTYTVNFGKLGDNSIIEANYAQGFHFSGYAFNFGTIIVNNSNNIPSRCAGGTYSGSTAMYDLNILPGGVYRNNASTYILHTLTNNGTLINSGTSSSIAMAGLTSFSFYSGSKITGGGTFRNNDLPSASTGGLLNLTINNTQGVTLETPLTMSGALTLTNGLLTTSDTNLLTLGNATVNFPNTANATGVSTATITSFVNGPLARVYTPGALNTNYYQFPVGKGSTYAPIWIAPATTGLTTFKVSYDDTSGGTGSGVTYTATNGKWNVLPDTSSNITNMNVRLQVTNNGTQTFTTASNVPVASSSLTGAYSNTFGDYSTYASNAIQSSTPATTFNQYISYAAPIACSGTPTPGNTIASATTFCPGESIVLSLQNATSGSGVTYQWQSSPDGIAAYTNVASATSTTLTVKPTVTIFYQCKVTCSSAAGTSTAVAINPTNSVLTTVAPTRCGYGTVTLQATANPDATVAWYSTATAGLLGQNLLGTGESFTTTSPISANTNYYAASETYGTGNYTVYPLPSTVTSYSNSNSVAVVSVSKPLTINSFDFIPTLTTTINFILAYTPDGINSGAIVSYFTFTPSITQVSAGLPITVPVNFALVPGSAYMIYTSKDTTSLAGYASVSTNRATVNPTPYPIISNGFNFSGGVTATTVSFWNFKITGDTVCSSARTLVAATVTAAPALTLSKTAVSICSNATSDPVTIVTNDGSYDQFTWSPSTGVQGDAINGWTFNPTTTTTYTLGAAQSTGACGASVTMIVTVNPLPESFSVTASSNSICADASTLVSMTSSYTNVTPTAWWAPSIQTIKPATAFTPTCDGTTKTLASSTFNNDSLTYSSVNVSASTKYTFSASNSSIYLVVMDASGTTPLASGIGSVNYFSNTNGQVNLYSYDNIQGDNNSLLTYTKSISCSPLPVATWSPITDLYSDETGTTPYVANTQTSIVYAKPNGTTPYTATMTTPSGCTQDVVTTITVNPLPVVSAASQVCVDSSITLSPTTGGTWASSDDLKATVDNSGVVTGVAAGDVTFTFTNTTTGCSATTETVTVNALPTVTATSQVCVDSSITLSPTTGGTWASSDDLKATVDNSGVVTGVAAGDVTFTFTNTTTGCSATTETVTVNALPTVTAASQVCVGSSITLSPTTGGTWTSSDDLKATVDNSGVVTGIATGDVTFIFTDTTTGCTATTSTVTVNALPVVDPITGTTSVSVGTTTTLSSTTNGGVWLSDNEAAATIDNSGVVTGVAAGTATISYTITTNGCSAATTTLVTVDALSNNQFDKANFKYYPNPVKDVLNISYANEITSVSLYNLLGQEVLNKTINANSAKLDLSSLPNGSYLVKINADNEIQTIKIIKQ